MKKADEYAGPVLVEPVLLECAYPSIVGYDGAGVVVCERQSGAVTRIDIKSKVARAAVLFTEGERELAEAVCCGIEGGEEGDFLEKCREMKALYNCNA